MLGGELSFHLLNVLLLTLGIAPLVLWRYRRAVLAGMQGGGAKPLAVASPTALRPPAPAAALDPLRWEARMRRRVFAAVLGPPSWRRCRCRRCTCTWAISRCRRPTST